MFILALLLVADSLRAFSLAVAPAESVQVTTAGSGAPVVLVPGMFGSAFGYRKVMPLLIEAGYRVIVVEPLAIGTSSRPEHADYSLTAQADRIAAALDQLGVRDAIVVAHSTSASMAYRLAYRRPDLVAGIVSIEGGPAERATTRGFRRALELAPWIKLFGGMKLVRRKIHGELIKASGDTSWVSEAVVEGYTAGAARDLDATLKAFLAMAERREPEQLRPHLAEVRCPVRLLVGTAEHQSGVRPEELVLLAQSLAAFAVDSVVGAGHYIQEEQPAAVVAAVQRLLLPVGGPERVRL
jgi:pimeloyl-ACP methyl ester carboxylesterase